MPASTTRHKKNIPALFFIVFILGACRFPPAAQDTEPLPTGPAAPGTVAEGTSQPSSPAADSSAFPVPPSRPLSTSGPWFIFAGEETLWAANPDGSGLTQIAAQVVQWDREWLAGIAPRGGNVAYISGQDDLHGLELYIYSLNSGETHFITSLVAEGLEPSGGERVEAVEAITYYESLAWSPDGTRLAFIAAIDGPSADLYLYSLEDETLTRLTSGGSQAYRLSWSPDGGYILHFGAYTFGTGAGYSMAGAWAAAADDSGVIDLYQPHSGDELVAGWQDARTALVYAWRVECGEGDLRAVDIIGVHPPNTLWGAYFSRIAVDPQSGAVVFIVPSDIASCNPDGQRGLFFLSRHGSPVRILEDDPYDVAWSPAAQLFFASTEFGVVAISSGGDWVQLESLSGNLPAAHPLDKSLAWFGTDGLWLSPLQVSPDGPQPQQLFSDSVFYASWDPEGGHLFFISTGSLYVFERATGQIYPAGPTSGGYQGGWARP